MAEAFIEFSLCCQRFCKVKRLTELFLSLGMTVIIVLERMGAQGDTISQPNWPDSVTWELHICYTYHTFLFSWNIHCSHTVSNMNGFKYATQIKTLNNIAQNNNNNNNKKPQSLNYSYIYYKTVQSQRTFPEFTYIWIAEGNTVMTNHVR